ncbi:M12 family metallo-peptidase [Sinomicrobium sp.]
MKISLKTTTAILMITVVGTIFFKLFAGKNEAESTALSFDEYSETQPEGLMDCSFVPVCGDGYTPSPVEYNTNIPGGDYQNGPFTEDYYSSSSEKVIGVYVVADYSVYQNLNDEVATERYIRNILFKQVADIYASEKVNLKIEEIKIWTKPDPFTGDTAGKKLKSFSSYLKNYNPDYSGNIAVLLSSVVKGGVARRAGEDMYKAPNGNNRPKFQRALVAGGVDPSDEARLPDWSNGVHILAHELGHSMGSAHTQGCFWNGNNTAIDGCKEPEPLNNDPCSRPPVPAPNKGTIMSYCKILKCSDVGVNFSLALGPQPGNLIRKTVANTSYDIENIRVSDKYISINQPLGSYDVERENVYRASRNIELSAAVDGNAYISVSAAEVNFKPGFEMTADKGKLHAYIGNYKPF